MPQTGNATRTTTPVWALKLAVITALVGIAGGVAGISVWLALQAIQFVAFGYPFGGHREAADAPSGLNRFLALTAAGVLTGVAWWAIRRWAKPVVSVTAAVGGKRMPALATVANAAVQILAVGLGASIGKEVAPREIGAWLSQLVTARAGLTARETRILVACGAAAGLAAVYDVPLGGALFAVEVLLGELTFATALPAFATSAIAAFTARLVIPDEVLYHVPAMHMSPSLLVWALVVGPLSLRLRGRRLRQAHEPAAGDGAEGVAPARRAARGVRDGRPHRGAVPGDPRERRALGLVAMNATTEAPEFAGLSPIVFLLLPP